MKSSKRRNFSRDEKVSILKRVFLEKENVSDVCKDVDIHVNQFYKWQVELFETGLFPSRVSAETKETREIKHLSEENEKLTKMLARKDFIIADITSEYVQLKKTPLEIYARNG